MGPSSEENIEVADETTIVTETTNHECWSNEPGGVSDIRRPSIQDRV
jgi:hypothetical protein